MLVMTWIPSRWFRFLTSITNTTITNKITRSESLPQNLQQCFKKPHRLEASLQLSERGQYGSEDDSDEHQSGKG